MSSVRLDDPDGQNSRVFIGNVSPNTDEDELEERFKKHGNVKGVVVLKGFAFVQFEKFEEAQKAIEAENGTEFGGKKIDVKMAKRKPQEEQKEETPAPAPVIEPPKSLLAQEVLPPEGYNIERIQDNENFPRGGRNQYDRSGPQRNSNNERGGNNRNNDNDRGNHRNNDNDRGNSRNIDNDRGNSRNIENDRGNSRNNDRAGNWSGNARGGARGGGGGGGSGRGGGPQRNARRDDFANRDRDRDQDQGWDRSGRQRRGDDGGSYNHDFNSGGGAGGGRSGFQGNAGQQQQQQASIAELRNDCEIVCVSKAQRQYAEMIEARLRNMGLRVDILFPNPDIPLGKILDNITSRGILFAILVSHVNEQHRSLTLNVLQGQQQEHRNMPIEDAMSFVAKNFEAAVEGKTAPTSNDSLPDDIRVVLGFLADNRPLSVMEYDKLIKFFAMKREAVLRVEYGENIPPSLANPPTGPPVDPMIKAKQDELHERIVSILNRPPPKETLKPSQAMSSNTVSITPEINATLQQAIDNLIKTGPNLLSQMQKGAGAGGAGSGSQLSYNDGQQGSSGYGYSGYGGLGRDNY